MSEGHRHLVIDVARTIAEAARGSGDWILPTDERISWLMKTPRRPCRVRGAIRPIRNTFEDDTHEP